MRSLHSTPAPTDKPARSRPGGTRTVPDPDTAWRVLALVTEWVKHAETKLAALLATAGVLGGVLFSLVRTSGAGLVPRVLGVACAAAVLASVLFAALGLAPRRGARRRRGGARPAQDPAVGPNPLYFQDIATEFAADPTAYPAVLRDLTADSGALVSHLARQIHALSLVARAKYRWADRATGALLLSVLLVAALAVAVLTGP